MELGLALMLADTEAENPLDVDGACISSGYLRVGTGDEVDLSFSTPRPWTLQLVCRRDQRGKAKSVKGTDLCYAADSGIVAVARYGNGVCRTGSRGKQNLQAILKRARKRRGGCIGERFFAIVGQM